MIIHIEYQGYLHIVVLINANVKTVTVWGQAILATGSLFQ